VGEWNVAPFLRTMLVLRVRALDSERVTGVLRGLDDMFAGECGVDSGLQQRKAGRKLCQVLMLVIYVFVVGLMNGMYESQASMRRDMQSCSSAFARGEDRSRVGLANPQKNQEQDMTPRPAQMRDEIHDKEQENRCDLRLLEALVGNQEAQRARRLGNLKGPGRDVS
jgi:hypothetical protein